jgi:hypothetical protein
MRMYFEMPQMTKMNLVQMLSGASLANSMLNVYQFPILITEVKQRCACLYTDG